HRSLPRALAGRDRRASGPPLVPRGPVSPRAPLAPRSAASFVPGLYPSRQRGATPTLGRGRGEGGGGRTLAERLMERASYEPFAIGEARLSPGRMALIAGPCVLEDEGMAEEVAREVKRVADSHGLPFIFKASYTKAN